MDEIKAKKVSEERLQKESRTNCGCGPGTEGGMEGNRDSGGSGSGCSCGCGTEATDVHFDGSYNSHH